MTREQFVERYEAYVAGVIALGTTQYRASLKEALTVGGADAVEAHGRILKGLGPEARTLLGKLYDAILPATPKANGNGHANGNGVHKPAAKVGV
jgi:hypothetical protein